MGSNSYQSKLRFRPTPSAMWDTYSIDFEDMQTLNGFTGTFDPTGSVRLYVQIQDSWGKGETIDLSFDNVSIESVPEPTAAGLFGLALGLVALRRRR